MTRVNIDHLLAARALVRVAGGVAQALAALEILEQLAGCESRPTVRERGRGPIGAEHSSGRLTPARERSAAPLPRRAATPPPPPPRFEQHVDACLAERHEAARPRWADDPDAPEALPLDPRNVGSPRRSA